MQNLKKKKDYWPKWFSVMELFKKTGLNSASWTKSENIYTKIVIYILIQRNTRFKRNEKEIFLEKCWKSHFLHFCFSKWPINNVRKRALWINIKWLFECFHILFQIGKSSAFHNLSAKKSKWREGNKSSFQRFKVMHFERVFRSGSNIFRLPVFSRPPPASS